MHKQPCRTSAHTGYVFVMEILNGHPRRCQEQFRMEKHVFLNLCRTLREDYELQVTKELTVEE